MGLRAGPSSQAHIANPTAKVTKCTLEAGGSDVSDEVTTRLSPSPTIGPNIDEDMANVEDVDDE